MAKEEPELDALSYVYTYRFTRVVFVVSSRPFLLSVTVKIPFGAISRLERGHSEMSSSVYPCGDVISGADSNEEAIELYTQPTRSSIMVHTANKIFHHGFNLRKFLSNGQPPQRDRLRSISRLHPNYTGSEGAGLTSHTPEKRGLQLVTMCTVSCS